MFNDLNEEDKIEEEFELKDPMRRGHVLAGNGATDGGLMNANFVGYLSHVQWAQLASAVFQEFLLMRQDLDGNFVNGLLPLLDAADEKLTTADFISDVVPHFRAAIRLAQHVFIGIA